MTLIGQLKAIRGVELERGLDESGLEAASSRLRTALPSEISELLRFSSGFRSRELGLVDFSGRSFRFEFPEIVPLGMPIAESEEGNFWVVDIASDGQWGAVFFFCHDPPVCVIQFRSLRRFLEACATNLAAPKKDAMATADTVWKADPPAIEAAAGRVSTDASIAAFASALPSQFWIYDLRDPTDDLRGFAWGRAGPAAECRRFKDELLFAVRAPGPARKGFLSRLFGGGST